MSSADLQHVPLGAPPSNPHPVTTSATDYYEILRVGQHADEDTIERVYRTLADRFHPDNPTTGDQETFLRLREAYETLSDRAERAKYNVMCQGTNGAARFRLRGREFFDGVRGGQNRRLAVLCLLYRQRIRTQDSPGISILELEQLTGCTREEITAALWYLCEKKWAGIGEFTTYSITAEGFDFVERKLEDRLEFRALATWSYYDASLDGEEPAGQTDLLPLDIEPALTQIGRNGHFGGRAASDSDPVAADHYEILGIGPRADEEAIERVYNTLAGRFHPDNPSTGDARTFQRIREAYETLSDPARRTAYDALRERTKTTERFRLRGREFFDGIKGEQLRRLAVLCLLYRQAAAELPGLTVLDLERLTGCTREELGSALWYLREKKWAKYGQFTEYGITAAGFDVVENKLDEREAARSRAWLGRDDGPSQNQRVFAVTAKALIASAETAQNHNPDRNGYAEQTEVQAEQPSDLKVEVLEVPAAVAGSPSAAEQVAGFEIGPAAEMPNQLDGPVIFGSSPASVDAVADGVEIEAEGQSPVTVEVLQPLAPNDGAARIAEEFAQLEAGMESVPAMATEIGAEYPGAEGDEPPAVMPQPAASDGALKIAEDFARLEAGVEAATEITQEDSPADTPEPAAVDETLPIVEEFALLEATAEAAPATQIAPEDSPVESDGQRAATASRNASDEAARIARAFARLEVDIETASRALAAKISATNDLAEEAPREREEMRAVMPDMAPAGKASAIAEPVRQFELLEPPGFLTADIRAAENRSGSLGRFVRRLLSFGDGPIAESQLNLQTASVSRKWEVTASNQNRAPITQIAEAHSTVQRPAPAVIQVDEAAAPPQQAVLIEVAAETFAADQPQALAVPQSAAAKTAETASEDAAREVPPEPIAKPVTRSEHRVEVGVSNPWAWLIPEDTAYPQNGASQASQNSNSSAPERADIKPEKPAREKAGIEKEVARVESDIKMPEPHHQDAAVVAESPGVSEMNDATNATAKHPVAAAVTAQKRVILSMGGKGGVGKTSVMTGLAEWFEANQIPANLLDLDTENKAKGSLTHFFGGRVPKIDIHTPAGLDAFVDLLAEDAPVILADMGAGAGKVTHDWFDKMYPDVAEAGVVFTAVGVVTADPASVESIVNWSAALQDRVTYVIVENCLTEHADFSYWQENDLAKEFRNRFRPATIRMDYRLADLENAARNYGVTLGRVASRSVAAPELQKASLVMRAQSYRRRMFAEFDKVKELLLP